MADVTDLNVQTGEIIERSFTPAEIADFERMRLENPQPLPPTKAELLAQIAALTAKVEALP